MLLNASKKGSCEYMHDESVRFGIDGADDEEIGSPAIAYE